jgi:hypothetical protein
MKDNKLIAEFMGFQQTTLGWYDAEETLIRVESDNTFDTLKFDTDWNWLMQVVEKIFETADLDNDYLTDLMNVLWDVPNKEAVYNACVEFVKWYNNK